ncbi:unnamed protein product [Didymodactylos carnosus]|uniref:Uncharacterized protein n=1 Tax=Didymodactylos carnosus TaxID=1234261 RepID=A0A813WBT2_9BILA|nr:unnamed protein product [Didymodactylos carnosus]CAF0849072.1 unnamed protein product [Didymodactylos carnosus]CAF3508006.1 unnamed protein product [Didymodactylos carnosus]CAF3636868.1 unnamed protein product [Didymodactylos carnosus]
METLQAIEWAVGVEAKLNSATCSKTNTLLTIFAYILIWLQPVMFTTFSVKGDKRFPLYYTIYTLIVAMINLFVGFVNPAGGLDTMTLTEKNNYGQYTCTYMGEYGHLVWKFAISTFVYQPTHFVYHSVILMIFMFNYDFILKTTIALGWTLTFFVSLYSVGNGAELTSYWCLLSVFADIPILIYTTFHKYNKQKKV